MVGVIDGDCTKYRVGGCNSVDIEDCEVARLFDWMLLLADKKKAEDTMGVGLSADLFLLPLGLLEDVEGTEVTMDAPLVLLGTMRGKMNEGVV